VVAIAADFNMMRMGMVEVESPYAEHNGTV